MRPSCSPSVPIRRTSRKRICPLINASLMADTSNLNLQSNCKKARQKAIRRAHSKTIDLAIKLCYEPGSLISCQGEANLLSLQIQHWYLIRVTAPCQATSGNFTLRVVGLQYICYITTKKENGRTCLVLNLVHHKPHLTQGGLPLCLL